MVDLGNRLADQSAAIIKSLPMASDCTVPYLHQWSEDRVMARRTRNENRDTFDTRLTVRATAVGSSGARESPVVLVVLLIVLPADDKSSWCARRGCGWGGWFVVVVAVIVGVAVGVVVVRVAVAIVGGCSVVVVVVVVAVGIAVGIAVRSEMEVRPIQGAIKATGRATVVAAEDGESS